MRVTSIYLTKTEAAEHLGRSPRTIELWVRRGHLQPAITEPGKPSLYALADIAACDAARRPQAWHDLLDDTAHHLFGATLAHPAPK